MPKHNADPMLHLPLTPVVLHILVALADSTRHGYAISQEVERQTDGSVRLGPGTLYGSLQRLLDSGLIAEASPPAGADGSHADRRRYYTITPLGTRVLRADTDRLAGAVRLARSRLGSSPAGG
jgi:DNA-binding PadR family transcriptional regulator